MSGAGWASMRSPAPDIVAEWSPRLLGTLVHLAVRRVVESDRRIVDADSATAAMRAVLPPGLAVTHRLMLMQRGRMRLLVWGERFDPRPDWAFVGAELVVDDVAIDLLWSRDGYVRADELKSGPLSTSNRRQAHNIADVCADAFGAASTGVRLISLAPSAARAELFVRSDRVAG